MKKLLPLYCALLLCFISCENDTIEGCQDRPLEELEWLQREIQSLEAQASFASFYYVQQAEYLGLPVFIVGNCCPSAFPSYSFIPAMGRTCVIREIVVEYQISSKTGG